jgi:hypothetical protein
MPQKLIPQTSSQLYISGLYALNLPGETSGDWHFSSVWFSDKEEVVPLAGGAKETDTHSIFGNLGVIDGTAVVGSAKLDNCGQKRIFVANHYRAILDLMVVGARRGYMGIVDGATREYLDTEEQKAFILDKAKLALSSDALTSQEKERINGWIAKENRNVYRGESYAI